jgi:hypothetical protein
MMQLVTIGLITFLTTDFILPDHARVLSLTFRGIIASIAASAGALFFTNEFSYFEFIYGTSILIGFFILIGNIKWISKKLKILPEWKKQTFSKNNYPVYYQVDSKNYVTSITGSLESASNNFLTENSYYKIQFGN